MARHLLFSRNNDQPIVWFDKFVKEKIKLEIKKHLTQFPNDVIEHCREFKKNDTRRFYGYEIIKVYNKH